MKEIFLIKEQSTTTPDVIGGAFNNQIHTETKILGFVRTEKTAKKWQAKPTRKDRSTHNSYERSYFYEKLTEMSAR